MKINGFFTSYWVGGAEVETKATLDLDTMEIETDSVDVSDMECETLLKEEFVSTGGEVYDICPECHQYATKVVMLNDRTGNGIHEGKECPQCGTIDE